MGVSVVIPARNEELRLPGCLESLERQSIPPDEIIIVDNGSTDGTADIALAFGCKVVREPVPGVGRARFQGCRAASSDVIAMTDADTLVPENWVARIAEAFAKHPACVAVTGSWRLFDGRTLARWYTAAHGRILQHAISLVMPPVVNMVGCNSAFRAEAYRRVGEFRQDLRIGEDLNLSLRLRAAGQVFFLPDLVVRTSGRRFQRSFFGGMSQYLPDATRQVSWYLLGRREVLPPARDYVQVHPVEAAVLREGIAPAAVRETAKEVAALVGQLTELTMQGSKNPVNGELSEC